MKSYYRLKAKIETIQHQFSKAKKNEYAFLSKQISYFCKELCLTEISLLLSGTEQSL